MSGAELGLAIPGVVVLGLKALKPLHKLYTDIRQAPKVIQDIQSNVESTNSMLERLNKLVIEVQQSDALNTGGLYDDLSNFKFEIQMLEGVYEELCSLMKKCDDPSFGRKAIWAAKDLEEAKRIGEMLRGHKANISFALQFASFKLQVEGLKSAAKREKDQEEARKQDMERLTLMIRDEKKSKNKMQKQDRRQKNINKRTEAIVKSEKNIKEWEEELRVLQTVQVANTTKSTLAENPVLKHFLESVDGDFGTDERRDLLAVEDLEHQTPGQLFLEREEEHDNLLMMVLARHITTLSSIGTLCLNIAYHLKNPLIYRGTPWQLWFDKNVTEHHPNMSLLLVQALLCVVLWIVEWYAANEIRVGWMRGMREFRRKRLEKVPA